MPVLIRQIKAFQCFSIAELTVFFLEMADDSKQLQYLQVETTHTNSMMRRMTEAVFEFTPKHIGVRDESP